MSAIAPPSVLTCAAALRMALALDACGRHLAAGLARAEERFGAWRGNGMNNRNFDWRRGVLMPGMAVVLGGCASVPENEESVAEPQEQETVSTYTHNDDFMGEESMAYPYDDDSWGERSAEETQVFDVELNADDESDSQADAPDGTQQSTVVISITKIQHEPDHGFMRHLSGIKIDSKPRRKTAASARYGTVSCIIKFDGQRYDDKLSSDLLPRMQTIESEPASFFISKVFASATRDIPVFINDDFPTTAEAEQAGDTVSHRLDFKDYLPGYKNAIMRMRTGNHFLSINPVSILQNRRVAAPDAAAKVYQKAGGKWVAQETLNGLSVSYPAAHDKSLALFRWKANDDAVKRGGILGVDVLVHRFTKQDFGKLHDLPGRVFYLKRGRIYTWRTSFSIKLPDNINPQWRFF